MLNSQIARTDKSAWKDMACYIGDPVVDFVSLAKSFDIDGEKIEQPGDVKAAFERAAAVNAEGRPYLINAMIARKGLGAELAWHPEISIAEKRTKKI
jgi:thiamine pyrophosphate-dependent acetolactate synthase large subunit-like protein